MRKVVLAAVLVLMASGAQAATLDVIGGQLMGASGVLVDGGLYDVQFLDGTCIDLFNGCDDVSDFTFQTNASALLAAQALLDQVFLDGVEGQFDSQPWQTNGCSNIAVCVAFTLFRFPPFPPSVGEAVGYSNYFDPGITQIQTINLNLPADLSDYHSEVYAVWSPTVVPEPSTALLLGLGLVGMAARRRM